MYSPKKIDPEMVSPLRVPWNMNVNAIGNLTIHATELHLIPLDRAHHVTHGKAASDSV